MNPYDETNYIRKRVKDGKSITNKQAKLLIEERDLTMRIGIGFFNSLTTLRAFLDPNAPQWAKNKVRKDTNHNKAALESWQKYEFNRRYFNVVSINRDVHPTGETLVVIPVLVRVALSSTDKPVELVVSYLDEPSRVITLNGLADYFEIKNVTINTYDASIG